MGHKYGKLKDQNGEDIRRKNTSGGMTNVLLNEQNYEFCLENSNFDERSKYC